MTKKVKSKSGTPVSPKADMDQYFVRAFSGTADIQRISSASTPTAERLLKNAKVIAPLVVTAAFVAPNFQAGVRRVFSGGRRARSDAADLKWTIDEWFYTEEIASFEQVAALNALLALPTREGFALDLPD